MKTQNTNFFQQISRAHTETLVKEVKETVAVNNGVQHKAVFGAVDYWNFQRSRRVRISRRHLTA